MAAPKAFMSWSSGKDSAFALHAARQEGLADIVGVLTTVNEVYDRVAMHGVRHALLDRQIEALGLPAIIVPLPSPCPNEVYEARMETACADIKVRGIDHMVFGDLFLEDIRAYRVEKLAAAKMTPLFPLWLRDTATLAREMIASGLVAHIVCLDPRKLDRSFAGRRFDEVFPARSAAGDRSLRRERRVSHGGDGRPDVQSTDRRRNRRDRRTRRFRVHGCDSALTKMRAGSPRSDVIALAEEPARHPHDRLNSLHKR